MRLVYQIEDIVATLITITTRLFCRASPPVIDGVYIRGLVLDGADWRRADKCLSECPPNASMTLFPIVQVGAISQKLMKARVCTCDRYCIVD